MKGEFGDDNPDGYRDEPSGVGKGSAANEVTDLGHLAGDRVLPTNDMALVSFLAGIGGWIAGAVGICPLLQGINLCFIPVALVTWATALFTGFVARGQLAQREEAGDDLAVWGLAAGGAGILLSALLLLLLLAVLIFGLSLAGLGLQ